MLSVESSLVPKDQEIWKLGDDFASKVVDVGVATGLMVAREIAIPGEHENFVIFVV